MCHNDLSVFTAYVPISVGELFGVRRYKQNDGKISILGSQKCNFETAAELLGNKRRKRKPWVTPEIPDLCDQRRDLKKETGEP